MLGVGILYLGLCLTVTAHVIEKRGAGKVTDRVSLPRQGSHDEHIIGGLLARLTGRQSGPCCSDGDGKARCFKGMLES